MTPQGERNIGHLSKTTRKCQSRSWFFVAECSSSLELKVAARYGWICARRQTDEGCKVEALPQLPVSVHCAIPLLRYLPQHTSKSGCSSSRITHRHCSSTPVEHCLDVLLIMTMVVLRSFGPVRQWRSHNVGRAASGAWMNDPCSKHKTSTRPCFKQLMSK